MSMWYAKALASTPIAQQIEGSLVKENAGSAARALEQAKDSIMRMELPFMLTVSRTRY